MSDLNSLTAWTEKSIKDGGTNETINQQEGVQQATNSYSKALFKMPNRFNKKFLQNDCMTLVRLKHDLINFVDCTESIPPQNEGEWKSTYEITKPNSFVTEGYNLLDKIKEQIRQKKQIVDFRSSENGSIKLDKPIATSMSPTFGPHNVRVNKQQVKKDQQQAEESSSGLASLAKASAHQKYQKQTKEYEQQKAEQDNDPMAVLVKLAGKSQLENLLNQQQTSTNNQPPLKSTAQTGNKPSLTSGMSLLKELDNQQEARKSHQEATDKKLNPKSDTGPSQSQQSSQEEDGGTDTQEKYIKQPSKRKKVLGSSDDFQSGEEHTADKNMDQDSFGSKNLQMQKIDYKGGDGGKQSMFADKIAEYKRDQQKNVQQAKVQKLERINQQHRVSSSVQDQQATVKMVKKREQKEIMKQKQKVKIDVVDNKAYFQSLREIKEPDSILQTQIDHFKDTKSGNCYVDKFIAKFKKQDKLGEEHQMKAIRHLEWFRSIVYQNIMLSQRLTDKYTIDYKQPSVHMLFYLMQSMIEICELLSSKNVPQLFTGNTLKILDAISTVYRRHPSVISQENPCQLSVLCLNMISITSCYYLSMIQANSIGKLARNLKLVIDDQSAPVLHSLQLVTEMVDDLHKQHEQSNDNQELLKEAQKLRKHCFTCLHKIDQCEQLITEVRSAKQIRIVFDQESSAQTLDNYLKAVTDDIRKLRFGLEKRIVLLNTSGDECNTLLVEDRTQTPSLEYVIKSVLSIIKDRCQQK